MIEQRQLEHWQHDSFLLIHLVCVLALNYKQGTSLPMPISKGGITMTNNRKEHQFLLETSVRHNLKTVIPSTNVSSQILRIFTNALLTLSQQPS